MKRFVLKALLFVFIAFIVLNLWGYLVIHCQDLSAQISWKIVLESLEQIDNPIRGNVLFLGDSVGNQLFPKSRPNSLMVNGAVLAAGHYILAAHVLSNPQNRHLKYIVLVSLPHNIGYRFERKQTYNCFMKPFYSPENFKYISKSLWEKINKKPLAHLSIFPFVKAAPCFSDVNFEAVGDDNPWLLSDIAVEYLIKLEHLCSRKGVKFILVCPPLSERFKKMSREWEQMREQIRRLNLENIFRNYFENIIYLDDDCFADEVHLKWDYVKKNREKINKKILPKEVLLQLAKYNTMQRTRRKLHRK